MSKVIELKTNGSVETKDGREFTRLIGGFGEDKPMFTIWQAGELLGLQTQEIRQNFERNADKFDVGIDFVDLKSLHTQSVKTGTIDITSFLKSIGVTHHKYGRTKQWLAFSFAGMMKLVKIATTKESWEIYNNFLEDYFQTKAENMVMKKTIQDEIKFLKEQKAFVLGMAFMTTEENEKIEFFNRVEELARRLTELEKSLTKQETIELLQPKLHYADTIEDTKGFYDVGEFAKILGVERMGRNNLFKWLRGQGMLMDNNIPYQSYLQYFKVIPIVKHNGQKGAKTLIKPNGVNYIVKRLIDDGKIVTKSVDQIISELEPVA